MGLGPRFRCGFLLIIAFSPIFARSINAQGRHFLWRLTNRAQPFYLLGSVHALRASDYPLGDEIDNAIEQSRRILFEYDNYHVDEGTWRRKMRAEVHYPAGIRLREKISPKTYSYLQSIASVRSSEYDDVKPWAIACLMLRHPFYHDVRSYYGIENYVLRRAKASAEFGGLETLDQHIHVLSGMNDVESEVFLLQTLVQPGRNEAEMARLIEVYKRGDIAAVAAIDAERERGAPSLYRRLISDRNRAWLPRIETEIHSGKPTMIVVGARHLCGADSVVSLLQARGYKFEQL
jgi:uncharacterized protein YbaP (TraB family)